MNPYERFLFPRLLDWTMSDAMLVPYRQQVLAGVGGEVLEIGFGTGLNLPFYPPQVTQLAIVEPHPGMTAIAQRRLAASPLPVVIYALSGEQLPLPDASVDHVVSTWTLCSIANVAAAIAEIERVLKPGGQFHFIEHGRSPEPTVQTWQNRLNPIQRVLGAGCQLNRDIAALVRQQFATVTLTQFYLANLPPVLGYTYQGIATKPA